MNSGLGNYRLSGALGSSWYAMPMLGFACAIIVGSLYSGIIVFLPYHGPYRLVLPLFFSLALGLAVFRMIPASKCRNRFFAFIMGLLISAMAIYAMWAMFVYLLRRRDTLGVEGDKSVSLYSVWADPKGLWESVKEISIFGWYSVNGYATSGWKLWTMWIAEAATFLGFVVLLTVMALAKRVFCERCGVWCRLYPTIARFRIPPEKARLDRIINGDISLLRELTPVDENARPHLAIDVDHCDACEEFATMSWKLMGADKVHADGWIVDRRLIAAAQVAELVALGEKKAEDGETGSDR